MRSQAIDARKQELERKLTEFRRARGGTSMQAGNAWAPKPRASPPGGAARETQASETFQQRSLPGVNTDQYRLILKTVKKVNPISPVKNSAVKENFPL